MGTRQHTVQANRTVPDAKDWMLQQVDRYLSVGSEFVCFGDLDVSKAARSGAVSVLLIGQCVELNGVCVDPHETVWAHGGQVVRSHHQQVNGLGMVALLRFPFSVVEGSDDVDNEDMAAPDAQRTEERGREAMQAAMPLPARSLSFFAPAGAPVAPTDSVPAISAELELLSAMFADERRMRMMEPFDGSHFLLHVDTHSGDANCYLILEIIVPDAYPAEASLLVTIIFGQVSNGEVLCRAETEAAAASCCASMTPDRFGEPMVFAMYEAAREWLAERSCWQVGSSTSDCSQQRACSLGHAQAHGHGLYQDCVGNSCFA